MYRTNDPRFRRRLNEIGQTLESANESAQSNLYIFGEHYLKPCLSSVAQSLTTCVDASCPSLNLSQRDRLRRRNQRGRAELSFDFYDDWDYEEENEGLFGGWGNDEFDRLTGGRGNVGGYGTVVEAQQPGRRRGMSYGGTGRRKSAVLPAGQDATVIPGSSGGFWGRLFGGSGKGIRYKPGAADLQEHPGARHRDLTEGEALLQDIEEEGDGRRRRGHGRTRSGTAASHETSDSLSSRGDIFPSDEEDDAIPLDDEFAMVLERRTTQSGGASGDTESSSQKTDPQQARRKSKRPSIASRTSTRRTVSSQSVQSLNRKKNPRSRAGSKTAQRTPSEASVVEAEESIPSLSELKREEDRVEREEEAEVERRRQEAQRLAAERGLAEEALLSSKEATPQESREPSQLPTPLPTDDEDETQQQQQQELKQNSEEQQQKLTRKDEEDDDDDDTPAA